MSESSSKGSVLWRYVVVLALLLPAVALKAIGSFGGDPPVVVKEQSLPDQAGWSAETRRLTDEESSMLQSPAWSQKIYTNYTTGDRVQVLLLQVNNTQNAHDPTFCMTGDGYDMARSEETEATWVGRSQKPYRVSRSLFTKAGLDVTMFYWIQTPTGTIPDMSAGFKFGGLMRALRGESTKGVAVRVICLPRGTGEPTPSEVGAKLWRSLNESVDIEQMVRGM